MTPKSSTHAEFPGTAVLWDDEYFEVISAEPVGESVRYELAPWRDEHTIRTFAPYSPESEAHLKADYERAERQRKHSRVAAVTGIVLGHLPEHVQQHLANELGVFPARMTILSTIPSVVLLGTCVWLYVSALIGQRPSPVPVWLWLVALAGTADSAARFQTAMSQNRGMGSLPGTILYAIYELVTGKKVPRLAEETKIAPPPPLDPEAVLRDSIEMRSWMLTLLPAGEQNLLAKRYGFDYRKHAYGVAWAFLACGAIGVASMLPKVARISAMISLLCAALLVVEQILRLLAFRRGPAGSVFGVLVRPFVRDLLERK